MSYDESCVRIDRQVYPYGEDQKSLGGRCCWEMEGSCLLRYHNAASMLLRILDDSGKDSFGATLIGPFMIGKRPAKARPYIIICSVHEEARVTVKRRIDKSGIPGGIGFRTHALNYYPCGNIKRFASSFNSSPGNDTPMSLHYIPDREVERSGISQSTIHIPSSAFYDSHQQIRMTGHSIYAKADTGLRLATGNAVSNGTILGYLTVAHLFSSWSEDIPPIDGGGVSLDMLPDSDSDGDDESHDGAHDSSDQNLSFASERPTPGHQTHQIADTHAGVVATLTTPTTSLPPSTELVYFGEVSALEEIQNPLDYTIVTIEDPMYHQRLAELDLSRGSHRTYTSAATPKTSPATAWTTHGPVNGMLRASPILMRPPGSNSFHFIYAFEYEGTIREGDCGSLLLDSFSKELYGMVVAASDRQSVVYIVSAKELLDQIRNDGWQLLDLDHDYMNSPSADNETTPVDSRTAAISPITTFVSQPQPMWSTTFQRYLITLWNAQHGRYYRQHYIEGQGWVFFDWLPVGQEVPQAQFERQNQPHIRDDSVQTVTASGGGPAGYGRGEMVYATYSPANPHPTSHYETLDPSFYVRGSAFFEEGKVFSILFTEPASANALNGLNPMADYNTNLSKVKYDEYVHTQVRRFIVVKRKREFCFAVPIFTYYGKATTKSGVVADEHAIAYSLGQQPQLVQGESPLRKAPIPIVMEENNRTLVPASRIYFAIHHPIQYNVKVKNLGHVHPDYLPTFLGYWNQENSDSKQDPEVTQDPNNTDRF